MRTALTSLVLVMIATAKAIGAESSGTETDGQSNSRKSLRSLPFNRSLGRSPLRKRLHFEKFI